MRDEKLALLLKISVLATMAVILQMIKMPLTMFFPEFLKIDISDVPALVGGFAFGPMAGLAVMFLKNLIHGITSTQTLWVGELANFLVGGSIVLGSSVLYRMKRTKKMAVMGLIFGTICMAIVGGLTNYYILLPLYGKVMGWPVQAFVDMAAAVNPMVKNLWGYILLVIVPFNILKGILSSVVVVMLYKPLGRFINSEYRRLNAAKKSI